MTNKEEWDKHVLELWKCARENNSTIPGDMLDQMRDILLTFKNTEDYHKKWERL